MKARHSIVVDNSLCEELANVQSVALLTKFQLMTPEVVYSLLLSDAAADGHELM